MKMNATEFPVELVKHAVIADAQFEFRAALQALVRERLQSRAQFIHFSLHDGANGARQAIEGAGEGGRSRFGARRPRLTWAGAQCNCRRRFRGAIRRAWPSRRRSIRGGLRRNLRTTRGTVPVPPARAGGWRLQFLELCSGRQATQPTAICKACVSDSTPSRQSAKARGKLERFVASPRLGDLALKLIAGWL